MFEEERDITSGSYAIDRETLLSDVDISLYFSTYIKEFLEKES
jgi:hypothetical protein